MPTPHKPKPAKKKTNYILVAANSNKDMTQESAFNHWYHTDHIGAMLESGVFHTVTRYENTKPQPGVQPQYLIMYETDWTDPEAIGKAWKETFDRVRASGREQPNENLDRFFPAALYKPIFVRRWPAGE